MERVYEMITIIQKAFPQGIDEVYKDLIGCLKEDFTIQNLAALLSFISGKDNHVVKRDILQCDNKEPNKNTLDSLMQAGYKHV